MLWAERLHGVHLGDRGLVCDQGHAVVMMSAQWGQGMRSSC